MSKSFQLQIITPNGTAFSGSVVHVNAPGLQGRFGVLVNHIPAIILLASGVVQIEAIGENRTFRLQGGVAWIQDSLMKILTPAVEETAVQAEAISPEIDR